MAKKQDTFAKRQREMSKKAKAEAKRARRKDSKSDDEPRAIKVVDLRHTDGELL